MCTYNNFQYNYMYNDDFCNLMYNDMSASTEGKKNKNEKMRMAIKMNL